MPLPPAATPLVTERFDHEPLSLPRLDFGDNYTQRHCQRVARLASLLAQDAGFDEATLYWFRVGALLHDIGKLIVPASVLNKRGPLTEEEWELMRRHPAVGASMVDTLAVGWDIRPMIRHHHERWDGTGYPDRLCRVEIPFSARILAVADAYDALTSTRSYRSAYSHDAAIAAMRAQRGRALDPSLLDLFVRVTVARMGRVGAPDHRSWPLRRDPRRIVA